jgi:hypothetical protein
MTCLGWKMNIVWYDEDYVSSEIIEYSVGERIW